MNQQLEISFEASARLLSVEEIYTLKDPDWLRIIKEDRRIERKPVGIHARTLSEWFSMWANTGPYGGIIVVGISDNGSLEGILSSSVAHLNDLERTGDVFCHDARYEFKRVQIENEKGNPDQLLLIRVYYNDKKVVFTTDSRAFTRRGESKREIKVDEIRELQAEKGEISLEKEDSMLVYPTDFDAKAIKTFANAIISRRNLEYTTSEEEVLELRRLGRFYKGNFVPNKACVLLFAKDPCKELPGARVRFLRFEGKEEGYGEKFNAVKDEWLEGTIPSLIVQAERLLDQQLREFSKVGKDGKFMNSPEYPKLAWYEAVVNACCHRSYNLKNITIFIKMFDDRLEIESPGGFLPFVTPDNIYDCSHPRNPETMNALYYLDFVKCAHEGTRRMRSTMNESQLPPPKFSEKQTSHVYFRVTLKNNIELRKAWLDSDASRVVGETIFDGLSEHERRVINHVAEYKRINVNETVRLTGKDWSTARNLLRKLVAKDILFEVRRRNLKVDVKAHYVLASTKGSK